jgi:hypothetical protein
MSLNRNGVDIPLAQLLHTTKYSYTDNYTRTHVTLYFGRSDSNLTPRAPEIKLKALVAESRLPVRSEKKLALLWIYFFTSSVFTTVSTPRAFHAILPACCRSSSEVTVPVRYTVPLVGNHINAV